MVRVPKRPERWVTDELRERWIHDVQEGMSTPQIAARDGYTRGTVRRHVYGRERGTGALKPPRKHSWHDLYPTAEEIWEVRWWGWGWWSGVTGINRKLIGAYLKRRGWRAQRIPHPTRRGSDGSYVSHAPCRECGRKFVPVEEMREDRTCGCLEVREKRLESGPLSLADIRKERERSLARQARRAPVIESQPRLRREDVMARLWAKIHAKGGTK